MTLTKRERRLLVTTITVLVLGGSYVLYVPLIRAWNAAGRDLQKQCRELASYRATLTRVPAWQADSETLRRQFGSRLEQFVKTSDVLKTINEVAAASGALISAQRELPTVDRDVYREQPVQCRLEATTESLVRFLYGLRSGSGFINVEQLQVAPRPDNPSVLRCDLLIHALSGKSERPTS